MSKKRDRKAALARRENNPAEAHKPGGVIRSSHLQMQMRTGPLPDPADLAAYEAIVPGSARLIVDKFAAQTDHRRDLESTVVNGNDRRADRGQWMAFGLALTAIIVGGLLAWNGKETAGLATIIGALASLMIVFITGKVLQGKDATRRGEG